MPWSSLADYVLAGKLREKEIEIEVETEYEKWRREVFKEIQVFVARVNDLELTDGDDREQFYDLISSMESRSENLRERNEVASASTEALIEMEMLIELLDETSKPLATGRAYLDPTSAEKKEMERERQEREESHTETAKNRRDEIADQIQKFMDALNNQKTSK